MSAEEDYSDGLSDISVGQQPTQTQIIKQVIDFFYGPEGGKFSKDWTKRLVRPRPRLTPSFSTTTPGYLTHFYDTTNHAVDGPSARIPYPLIILGGVLILAIFYLLLFLIIDRLRCCKKNRQEATRRRNREDRTPTDGLYHIEEDALGSGNTTTVSVHSPKSSKAEDLPPSYEDAVLASGQQQLAEAGNNQSTPSNVNNDSVEVN